MEQIVMTAEELDRLLALNDGDAALLHLHGKRGRLPALDESRLREARRKLSAAGLAPPVAAERPSYGASEIAHGMLTDPGFRTVVDAAESIKKEPLSSGDRQTLYSIYHWRGLPPGVMLPLLHYCDKARGKRPFSLKQVDKEAERWEKDGIVDEASAERYIGQKEAEREVTSRVYRGLGIYRVPGATEKRYVASWIDLGFTPEAIAVAYDKTVLNAGWPAWQYCDSILRRWHEKGWHTPEQIEAYDQKPSRAAKNDPPASGYTRNTEARKRVRGE